MARYFTLSSIGTSLIGSIGTVSLRPKTFFENMKAADGYRDSVIFMLLILLMPSLINSYMISTEKMHTIFPAMEGVGLLLTWFWAGYLYWCVKLFTEHEIEHTTAFQIAAYSNVPILLDFSALLIAPAFIWQLLITWRALVHHVGLSYSIAAWFMAIPVVMLLAGLIAFVMIAAMAGVDLLSPLIEEDFLQDSYR